MRTIRSSSRLPGGGWVSAAPGDGVCWGGGVCMWAGVLPGRGCMPSGGVCPVRVSAQGGRGWQTPPVDRMTDTCENITLAQLRFADGENCSFILERKRHRFHKG